MVVSINMRKTVTFFRESYETFIAWRGTEVENGVSGGKHLNVVGQGG